MDASATTETAIAAGDIDRGAARPAGWVDRLFALPGRLPGVAPIWWVAIFVVMTVVPASLLWATGAQAAGEIDSRLWVGRGVRP